MFALGGISGLLALTTTRMSTRKHKMLSGVVYFLVGAFLNGFAVNIEMLIIGRLLFGIGVGCLIP
jgi:MFS transporter, SP family, sugar:H+ symporter